MTPEIEALYQQIGQYIRDAIAEDWALAWAAMEVGNEDGGTTWGRYKTTLGPTEDVRSFWTDHHLYELFSALRAAMPDKWESAIFTLNAQDQFQLDFGYEKSDVALWKRTKAINRAKGLRDGW